MWKKTVFITLALPDEIIRGGSSLSEICGNKK
jgi:hypothetical protein